jgi:lipoprotein-releasing system ATP-binding protein
MNSPLLTGINIVKSYVEAQQSVDILHGVNIDVNAGETLAILGASGSGKSTLLHILGTLDTPSSGDVLFKGESLLRLSKKQQAGFRNSQLGFVYQFHHLLPEFSATENVAMPKLIAGVSKKEAYARSQQLLERVGLAHRYTHRPHQMSGGERQRVAIARAMINQPSIIMADEPTGNLDNDASAEILSLIHDINRDDKTCFIIVTHDHSLANSMDRSLQLVNGNFTDQQAPNK